jgi:endonuclease/exonuclease/phosphatase family metal-dependent hydrolase
VRVGTWNIAWLGGEKRNQLSDDKTIQTMADMIAKRWSIDLIALQEINTNIDGEYRGDRFTTHPWKTLRSALEKYGYKTATGNSGQGQRIVLAWRKPITLDAVVSELNVPDSYKVNEWCRSSHLRRPLAGKFHAERFDFWFIALHLKSGFGNRGHCTDDVRDLQSYYLAGQIKTLEKTDRDILLVGDFNAAGSNKSLSNLLNIGLETTTDKQDRSSDSYNRSQGKGKYGKVLDHIMLDKNTTSEWIKQSTVIFKPENPEDFTRRFSDHFPVWADFDTRTDDD